MIHNTARLPLPALVSAGEAGDLRSGKQLIGADGSIVTGTMPEVAGKTITPGTTAQTAVAAGRYVTGDVDVAGDSSLEAENIAEGATIFGVTGTHSGLGKKITAHIGTGPNPLIGRTWLGVGESGVVFIMANQDYTLVAPSMIYLADTPYSENYNYSGGITQYNTGSVNYQIYYITDDFWIST